MSASSVFGPAAPPMCLSGVVSTMPNGNAVVSALDAAPELRRRDRLDGAHVAKLLGRHPGRVSPGMHLEGVRPLGGDVDVRVATDVRVVTVERSLGVEAAGTRAAGRCKRWTTLIAASNESTLAPRPTPTSRRTSRPAARQITNAARARTARSATLSHSRRVGRIGRRLICRFTGSASRTA